MTSRLNPRRSDERRYIRSSTSALSCDSVPPAPGWIVTIAFLRSCSPPSIFLVSPVSTVVDKSSSPRARSSATGSPASAHSTSTARSSVRRRSDSLRSRSSSRRRRRWSSFCAPVWSFQKSGSETRSSIEESSSAERGVSKIAPQVRGAARQILIPAKLFVQLYGHKKDCRLRIDDCRCKVDDLRLLIVMDDLFYRTLHAARSAAAVSASESQA